MSKPQTTPDNLHDLVGSLIAWRDGALVRPSPRERYSQRLAGYAAAEITRLQTAINEAYRIMCSGKPPHSARETNARRVLRLAGVTVKKQSA